LSPISETQVRIKGPLDRTSRAYTIYRSKSDRARRSDAGHRELMAMGADILDPQAQYLHCRESFHAVFFNDPSGIKLEIAYRSWEDVNQ